MSPAEMLDAIDAGLARRAARRRGWRRLTLDRQPVLATFTPTILGVHATAVSEVEDGPTTYGYDARAARRIRAVIEQAAYADLRDAEMSAQ